MRDAAAKGTTQIETLDIGRLGQEENPAMSTTFEIVSQVRVLAKSRTQGLIVG
jgi:hypothetical protein